MTSVVLGHVLAQLIKLFSRSRCCQDYCPAWSGSCCSQGFRGLILRDNSPTCHNLTHEMHSGGFPGCLSVSKDTTTTGVPPLDDVYTLSQGRVALSTEGFVRCASASAPWEFPYSGSLRACNMQTEVLPCKASKWCLSLVIQAFLGI